MGMTYSQYWEDDCELVRAYRRAYEIRQDNENRYAWLQGLYVYEAICDASPILHAFAKSGTRARPYAEKPYEFNRPKRMTKAEKYAENKRRVTEYMNEMTARFNESFRTRQAKQKEAELQKQLEKTASAGEKLHCDME